MKVAGSRRATARLVVSSLVLAGVSVAQPSRAEAPVLHTPLEAGSGIRRPVDPVSPAARVMDGRIDDWIGRSPGFGGATVYSAGELIYSDHIFDAYGADDGTDLQSEERNRTLYAALPPAERVAALSERLGDEVGIPALEGEEAYGDAGYQDAADLLELRVAADAESFHFLARTTTMRGGDTALLLLFDTEEPKESRTVPFGTGIRSSTADLAVFASGGTATGIRLRTGKEFRVQSAMDAEGYSNGIEVVLPRKLVERRGEVRLAAATGLVDARGTGFQRIEGLPANLLNVAFRDDEPVATWMDRLQALSLASGSIDSFATTIDVARLLGGYSEQWRPGPGYHERVFTSSERISDEQGLDGIHQHYGVYVPRSRRGGLPLTFWMHWRGGKAHSAAVITPRVFRDNGDLRGGIVVGPRGRGTSTWYVGKGLVDFDEVWRDVLDLFPVDRDRVYVTGHSMGGWASYLLPILYPDRFAATMPVSGPVTQGGWTGVDIEGCDELRYDDYTPCYAYANDSDPRVQHTRRLLDNLRNVPVGIFQGGLDELVPVTGVTRQVERLVELGYRHRYYLFPTYEHYSHPIVDEWAEGVRYLDTFRRERDPSRVVYVRDMPFERSVERGPSQFESPQSGLEFTFDSAYWMSRLRPADPTKGAARVDARTLARPEAGSLALPEAGGPAAVGQTGPFAMTGLAWLPMGEQPPARNAFEATLGGAVAVSFDLSRMGIDSARPLAAAVTSDERLRLTLRGDWTGDEVVRVGGRAVRASIHGNRLSVALPPGTSLVRIHRPRAGDG